MKILKTEICVGRSELRALVGAKEGVTKECENEDCCVWERQEKMVMDRRSHASAANTPMDIHRMP